MWDNFIMTILKYHNFITVKEAKHEINKIWSDLLISFLWHCKSGYVANFPE